MSERKVLNKYFPPNFDPSLIPRRSIPRAAQQTVRLMSPFNMSCNSCKEVCDRECIITLSKLIRR